MRADISASANLLERLLHQNPAPCPPLSGHVADCRGRVLGQVLLGDVPCPQIHEPGLGGACITVYIYKRLLLPQGGFMDASVPCDATGCSIIVTYKPKEENRWVLNRAVESYMKPYGFGVSTYFHRAAWARIIAHKIQITWDTNPI